MSDWINNSNGAWYIYGIVLPIIGFFLFLLIYIIINPWLNKVLRPLTLPHEGFSLFEIDIPIKAKRILVPIDFSSFDKIAINQALQIGGNTATYILVHVVETVAARYSGKDSDDSETRSDESELKMYETELIKNGYASTSIIAYGNPAKAIADTAVKEQAELIVMAALGHKGIKDIWLGSTLDSLRHKVKIPVMIAR
jgi:manganese transport protein